MKKSSLVAVITALSFGVGFAQNSPAAPPAPANPPASQGPTAPVDNSVSSILDYTFNHKAGEGTAAKAGSDVASSIADKIKAVDVLNTPGLDNPVTRDRFETYLSLKEVPDDQIKEYFDKIDEVSQKLKEGNTFAAWKLLYELSAYEALDDKMSRVLAHCIEDIWNSNRTQLGIERTNSQLQNDIDSAAHNADIIAEERHHQDLEEFSKYSGKLPNQNAQTPNNASLTNSPLNSPTADPVAAEAAIMPQMSGALQRNMGMTEEYLNFLQARASISLNEIKENGMNSQDKTDFASFIKMLYDKHFYYHVVIAADFYRALFGDEDFNSFGVNHATNNSTPGQPNANSSHAPADLVAQGANGLKVNARVPADMLAQLGTGLGMLNPLGPPPSDHPLSLAEEVASAGEINQRVSEAVEVFKYKAQKGEIAAAAQELQEAFLANEYHPALQGLARTDKEKVGEFLTKVDVLKNQLEVRDFEQVETQLGGIKQVAADFDSTKPLALVNAVKLESRLRLGKAKLLAQGGDLDNAMKEFQTAAEEWPGNPDLQTSASGFFKTEDVQNESTTEFDRLFQDQNYREISEKAVAFAPAIKGDATREQQLKDALLKVQKAEMASEKANMMVLNGDVDGAWETIELAAKDWPDDMKLNKLLAGLSGRGADFVSAINKARDAEDKKELGYSLTWYVNAQNFYPGSSIAKDGIDRISKQILTPPAQPDSAPAATSAN